MTSWHQCTKELQLTKLSNETHTVKTIVLLIQTLPSVANKFSSVHSKTSVFIGKQFLLASNVTITRFYKLLISKMFASEFSVSPQLILLFTCSMWTGSVKLLRCLLQVTKTRSFNSWSVRVGGLNLRTVLPSFTQGNWVKPG